MLPRKYEVLAEQKAYKLALLQGSNLRSVIVGCNSYIGEGCSISDTVILGNDTYTNDSSRTASRKKGEVVLGIGEPLDPCQTYSRLLASKIQSDVVHFFEGCGPEIQGGDVISGFHTF